MIYSLLTYRSISYMKHATEIVYKETFIHSFIPFFNKQNTQNAVVRQYAIKLKLSTL